MIKSLDIEKLLKTSEIVLFDSDLSKLAHKELFNFRDDIYIHLLSNGAELLDEIIENGNQNAFYKALKKPLTILNSSIYSRFSTMHLVLEWEHMLQVSMWNFDSNPIEIINLLSNAGLSLDEIGNIKTLSVQGMFVYLLHKSRFDIFRRICHLAKIQFKSRLSDQSIQIICHLASPETRRIVASSL